MKGRVFRNYYEGHIDKTGGGGRMQARGEVGLAGVGSSGWGKMQTTVIEQQ